MDGSDRSPGSSVIPQAGLKRLRRRLMQPAALPLVLLLLALSTVFLSGNDRGHFYRSPLHNSITADHMAVAKNLSPKHGFLGFGSLEQGSDGAPAYRRPYNRFPIGGYLLVKLTILPFEDDFPAEIRAARTLMLVFFVLGAVLAWLSLCRLAASRWIALAATLLSFSSFWLLYYNDMVATETMPSLFGVMLAFHGMVVFVQEGRFRQLLVKACAALLLGWHVYALLLPFIVFGLARELIRALPLSSRFGRSNQAPRGAAHGRYLALGVVALLFGAALLSFNLGNEYFAHGGAVPLTELPTVTSIAKHLGANEEFNAPWMKKLAWPAFLEGQLRRTGGMTLPYGLIEPIWGTIVEKSGRLKLLPGLLTLGIVACGVCLMALPFVRHGLLLAALMLSGFCWALPMRRHIALHEFETVFYVVIPLTVFLLVFSCIRKLAGDRFVAILAVAAAWPVFLLSSVKMAAVRPDIPDALVEAALMRDFEVIRGKVGEGVVRLIPAHGHVIAGMPFNRLEYFLAGKLLVRAESPREDRADFVLLPHRDEGPALLTPDNQRMFLYDRVLHDASYDEPALGDPIIASDWNVYLKDGRLVYVGEDCANVNSSFFLSMTPREGSGPAGRERRGIDGMEFGFRDVARRAGGKCVAVIELPSHDLLAVRTGQVGEEGGLLWEGEHPVKPAVRLRPRASPAAACWPRGAAPGGGRPEGRPSTGRECPRPALAPGVGTG